MKKVPGVMLILLIAITTFFTSTVLLFKGGLSDRVTLGFLIIIGFIFIIGVFFSIVQQRIIDRENSKTKGTIESSIYEKITRNTNAGKFDVVNGYYKIYEKLVKKYFSIISSLSSLLITFGLIGTVLGLIISMGGLKELVVSSGNNSAILNTMTTVLSGVDVSFYTTLFGSFLGGIMLRICLIVHEQYAQTLLNRISMKWISLLSETNSSNDIDLNNMKELKNFLLIFRTLHIELTKQVNNTNVELENFQKSLSSLSNIPIHNQLTKLSQKIEENSHYFKEVVDQMLK